MGANGARGERVRIGVVVIPANRLELIQLEELRTSPPPRGRGGGEVGAKTGFT